MLTSIVLGLVVSLGYNLDILENLDVKAQIPYIGNVLTGFVLTRAATMSLTS